MNPEQAPRSFTLTELLSSIQRCLEHSFPSRYWIRAEVSDLRRSGGQGHGYLELLEKGRSGEVIARVRATIWASVYNEIERSFARSGVGRLASGMSILCLVGVSYHPQYGLSLNIADVDPNYSLGEIARLRMETIARLKRDGLYTMNKELSLPRPLQRLAIISSPTAAGYGDFMRQLHENAYGVRFYTALFRAQMQGERTTASILSALGTILEHRNCFDAVVIIRGGGAVSELRAFDDFTLCESVAQFPLPVITGIGHERDTSVLDLIAHTSLKTPTAVAAYLIDQLGQELALVHDLSMRMVNLVQGLSMARTSALDRLLSRLPDLARKRIHQEQRRLLEQRTAMLVGTKGYLEEARLHLGLVLRQLPSALAHLRERQLMGLSQRLALLPLHARRLLESRRMALQGYEQAIRLADPANVLRRGFALATHEGRIVTRSEGLARGAELTIRFVDGSLRTIVEEASEVADT